MKEYIIRIDETQKDIMGGHPLLESPKELIRCKDCKHRSNKMYDYYDNPNNMVYVCQIHDLAKKPEWFCGDGERNDND